MQTDANGRQMDANRGKRKPTDVKKSNESKNNRTEVKESKRKLNKANGSQKM